MKNEKAIQYGFTERNGSFMPDTLLSRFGNDVIPNILLHDSLWRGIPDNLKAVFIDRDAGYWAEHHPRVMNITQNGIGDIPLGIHNLGGIAVISKALQRSNRLREYIDALGDKLGKEGVLLIIEAVGTDNDSNWRKRMLVDGGYAKSDIYHNGNYLVWHARERKKTVHRPIDAMDRIQHKDDAEWRKTYFPLGFARILAYWETQGYHVINFQSLEQLLRNTRNIPDALAKFREGVGVRVIDLRCGICEYDVTTKGNFIQVKDCHIPKDSHRKLPERDLIQQRVAYERIMNVRQILHFEHHPKPSQKLERICFDCLNEDSAIRQTAIELGLSPVGHLFYIEQQCPGGHINERYIGIVE